MSSFTPADVLLYATGNISDVRVKTEIFAAICDDSKLMASFKDLQENGIASPEIIAEFALYYDPEGEEVRRSPIHLRTIETKRVQGVVGQLATAASTTAGITENAQGTNTSLSHAGNVLSFRLPLAQFAGYDELEHCIAFLIDNEVVGYVAASVERESLSGKIRFSSLSIYDADKFEETWFYAYEIASRDCLED